MSDERLEDLLARLESERLEADRLYNDALTSLDRPLEPPALPDPPSAYDDTQLAPANEAWDILPSGPPATGGSIKGRLAGFVWRLVGPALEAQKRFNAALIDHLNRNTRGHADVERSVGALTAAIRQHLDEQAAFRSRLLEYLQAITGYVDTKDRAIGGQVKVVNAGVSGMADDWLKRNGSLAAREERLRERLQAIDDLRTTAALAQQTALSLKREVERLIDGQGSRLAGQASPTAPPDLDAFKYLGFEDEFRGSAETIRARLADYVPLFDGRSDVVDLGCGRGEFLDLLQAAGITARGVDLNHEMVETSRARGFEVAEGDALGFLESVPDASLGGVFAAQVAEHLEPAYLMRLIDAALAKLRPEGVIVLETINAACWLAFFESYIRDLTHVRPLHPETLQYLLRASGFREVEIRFRPPEAEAERLDPVPVPPEDAGVAASTLASTFNDNVAKLNTRLFTHLDYAAIGHK